MQALFLEHEREGRSKAGREARRLQTSGVAALPPTAGASGSGAPGRRRSRSATRAAAAQDAKDGDGSAASPSAKKYAALLHVVSMRVQRRMLLVHATAFARSIMQGSRCRH